MTIHVAFLLTPNLHLLDLAGPAQVFSTANDLGRGYRLSYVAETETILTAQGIPVQAQVRWPDLGADDLVIVPGWSWSRPRRGPTIGPETAQRLRRHHANGGTVASVCSGADALGTAGLLDGRQFTTHHDLAGELAAHYPQAKLVRDVLYVTDDRVTTSAGIASGIDLAMHLVAGNDGPEVAARVAREMVVYARRNGHELQESVILRHRGHLSDLSHRVQDLIDERYADRLLLSDLARQVGVSERTLTRVFVAATGLTPLRYQQLLRLEKAEHLIGHGTTVEAAARTVGFEDARMLRRLRSRSEKPAEG
ncbi:GlxA family transcriptional regulator [Nocardioides panzhihuensis]|uniref:Transcriptional regulator GlxA family with amidase domain n=1 Tax=Nocardioides panzhihuensis TaxID=860243 RepID=A0A7Z0DKF6_9ACTN|nr:DJ-1/PfpI family protein [Nocardioides panzhihuensis]NYI77008.1 transcriptional regulator GlxA family with amidase domain [Nocardioides panzhihuensis]